MTAILIAGTKTTFRWQNIFFVHRDDRNVRGVRRPSSSAATPTSTQQLRHAQRPVRRWDRRPTSSRGGKAGDQPGRRRTSTRPLPAIFVVMTFMMWNWWSVYLSGELKSAMNREPPAVDHVRRADLWDVVFIALGAILFFKVIRFDFVVAREHGRERGLRRSRADAFYQFLAALVQNIPVLTVLIVGSFLFWSLPAMVGNTFMPIRSVFAWSFDRLLPGEARRGQRADPFAGPGDPAGHGDRHRDARLERLSTDFFTWLALGVAGRRGLRRHRWPGGARLPESPSGPLPGVAGEREVRWGSRSCTSSRRCRSWSCSSWSGAVLTYPPLALAGTKDTCGDPGVHDG